jgi:CRISPR/Cas system CSM-associated protein Csm3 (group 7 of RAMP superfamily)
MKTVIIKFELLSWWHTGSGMGRGGDADSIVIRDPDGLPYLPGKTIKGLLRDAVQLAADFNHFEAGGQMETLFGPSPRSENEEASSPETSGNHPPPGELHFESAYISKELAQWICASGEHRRAALYETIASTALESGVAKEKTLRVTEVSPPMILKAIITGPDRDDWVKLLKHCAPLIHAIGAHRHRGLGRCQVSIEDSGAKAADTQKEEKTETITSALLAPSDNSVLLEITLLNDVIFSETGATLGGHDSLDYIPGSALLGAVVARVGFNANLFLSGRIRFRDGLPIWQNKICWPVPLHCHYEKLNGVTGKPINGLTDTTKEAHNRATAGNQAQQLRNGYLAIEDNNPKAAHIQIAGEYRLKTARDRAAFGRPREQHLFAYDTIPAGSRFLASIQWDSKDAEAATHVEGWMQTLNGTEIRLGRCKGAEFGRARIRIVKIPKPEMQQLNDGLTSNEKGSPPHPLHFYLVSDLALTKNGAPSLIPTPKDFGLNDKEWDFVLPLSFVRTRRYSPWVAFHHTRITERQVICRGSVITFARNDGKRANNTELTDVKNHLTEGIGEYRHEGLGWVLLNPEFLLNLPELIRQGDKGSTMAITREAGDQPLLVKYVERRYVDEQCRTESLKEGIKWAEQWLPLTMSAAQKTRRSGKSQWSQVRQCALESGGAITKLEEFLKDICEKGLRKEFWNPPTKTQSLWGKLSPILGGDVKLPEGMPETCRNSYIVNAIAAAATTLIRRLQETTQDKHNKST